jgi:hypothetical protein
MCESRIGIILCIYSITDLIFVVLVDVAEDKSLKKCLLILDLSRLLMEEEFLGRDNKVPKVKFSQGHSCCKTYAYFKRSGLDLFLEIAFASLIWEFG